MVSLFWWTEVCDKALVPFECYVRIWSVIFFLASGDLLVIFDISWLTESSSASFLSCVLFADVYLHVQIFLFVIRIAVTLYKDPLYRSHYNLITSVWTLFPKKVTFSILGVFLKGCIILFITTRHPSQRKKTYDTFIIVCTML